MENNFQLSLNKIMPMKKFTFFIATVMIAFGVSCDRDGDINIFSVEDDIKLGAQVDQEIKADPTTYPILSRTDPNNARAYELLDNMVDQILDSADAKGELNFRNEFLWEVYIINDDNVINAFCTPGGYIYVYTGLIKFLFSYDALAGVMGHEIAHADKRHSTDAMTRTYGIQLLFDIVFGRDQGAVTQIAQGMLNLSYSRKNETEADEFSVKYLSGTKYDCSGAARFFEQLEEQSEGGSVPDFLSTHPSPDKRVENILIPVRDHYETVHAPYVSSDHQSLP